MVLRRQCCRLVGVSRPHTSYSPSLSRPLHTTLGRAQESGDSDHGIGQTPESAKDNTVPSNAVAAAPSKRPFNVIPREEQELPEGFQKEMKAADIDRKMTPAELGLKMKRNSRRQFATWLLKAGRRYEHFPQNLLHELEERRVEKIRKRAEERMFARMNDFFNSLTSEEIENVSLKELAVKPRNGPGRERLEEPTPFQRLMTETLNPARLKEVESKVLLLLQTYDSATHTMYRNYIDWSDYKLQKQIIWIKFIIDPKDLELYGDLISRLQAIELLGRRGSGREAHSTMTKYGMSYTRDKNDLAHYVGEALGPHKFLPAISPHYFFNRANESTPFLRNPKFKPWRPLSHKTRQQMFDAWREGMGLRNIAWLGGVSWRRVDGIVGILKREWDFVQQGGKLETQMAEYMEGLLEKTPIDNEQLPPILTTERSFQPFYPVVQEPQREKSEEQELENFESNDDLEVPDVPLADPPLQVLSSAQKTMQPIAPAPGSPIIINTSSQSTYLMELDKQHKKIKDWETSQKEPLVNVPIKRTKQYFAIIQEMEEYDEKRAARALDGTGGRTISEREEGMKLFERAFGLRSLGGRENYNGTPPWELSASEVAKRRRAREISEAKAKAKRQLKSPKERVVWQFEDVSWVKQRNYRPRKNSWAGRLDHRVQTESGVARYGPFGIGGGIEGVGGVKQVIKRGRDGILRVKEGEPEKKRIRREIIV